LNARFKERVKISRDRAWLAGPGDDPKWREHLMDVLKAAADTVVDSRENSV